MKKIKIYKIYNKRNKRKYKRSKKIKEINQSSIIKIKRSNKRIKKYLISRKWQQFNKWF